MYHYLLKASWKNQPILGLTQALIRHAQAIFHLKVQRCLKTSGVMSKSYGSGLEGVAAGQILGNMSSRKNSDKVGHCDLSLLS
jgi:hypothetical protein